MTMQTLLLTHIGTAPVMLDGSQLSHLISAFLGHEIVLDMLVFRDVDAFAESQSTLRDAA